MKYTHELAFLKELFNSGAKINKIEVDYSFWGGGGKDYQFRIGPVGNQEIENCKKQMFKELEDGGFIKKNMWAS